MNPSSEKDAPKGARGSGSAPGPGGSSPPPSGGTTRHFTESSPDGFAGNQPSWVAYCPRCGSKLPLEEHAECRYFQGGECEEGGSVSSIECSFCNTSSRPERPGREGPEDAENR